MRTGGIICRRRRRNSQRISGKGRGIAEISAGKRRSGRKGGPRQAYVIDVKGDGNRGHIPTPFPSKDRWILFFGNDGM